ncbi:MAG: Fic family protein, partial [Arcobacteraceae bacterium]|nr:Fic family protein [Arcobacteraceae bacterium]
RWTYTSNAIEGNTVSLGDTSFIIEQGLTVSGITLREHEEVVGHARAIDIIYELLNKDILLETDMFNLHKAVQTTLNIDIECPLGDYKVVENGRYIRGESGKKEFHPYPHPNDIKYLINIWFDEFKDISKQNLTFEETVRKYTRCHIGFTSIHPFFDGNGRVSRLLSNIYMLKNGFLPIIIDNKKRDKYIELLIKYNLSINELDNKSSTIMEENEYFDELYEFFKSQYQNSKEVLDEVKSKLR